MATFKYTTLSKDIANTISHFNMIDKNVVIERKNKVINSFNNIATLKRQFEKIEKTVAMWEKRVKIHDKYVLSCKGHYNEEFLLSKSPIENRDEMIRNIKSHKKKMKILLQTAKNEYL